MYAVAVSQGNAQVALAFQFLHEVRRPLAPAAAARPQRCAHARGLARAPPRRVGVGLLSAESWWPLRARRW